MSKIDWTDKSWNPVVGCTRHSPGCDHCYASELHSKRHMQFISGNGKWPSGKAIPEQYAKPFNNIQLLDKRLGDPLRGRKPLMYFVNSVSDLFHEQVPLEFIQKVFNTMTLADHHLFQILTKRAERLAELAPELDWPDNVWMGVTVEVADCVSRIDLLRKVPAKIRWISFEPLLGDIPDIDLTGIHWAVVGGESGAGARPMKEDWVKHIKTQCEAEGTAFYFKQWGTNKLSKPDNRSKKENTSG